MKRALITGIAGQDGSYLAEYLLSQDYEVHGIIEQNKLANRLGGMTNIMKIENKINLYTSSLDNYQEVLNILDHSMPDECYHLASNSFVYHNFDEETPTLTNNFLSSKIIFMALKNRLPDCRIYFAGSSEMFGDCDVSPQNELTPFNPRSTYGVSKLSSYFLAKFLKKNSNLFISTGFLFNHESPRRGFQFVTRKISSSVAKIYFGLEKNIYLGNLDAFRDWGYAPEYVQGMHKMLQESYPDDFVLATGNLNSVKTFLTKAFQVVDLNYEDFLKISPEHFRSSEKTPLCGDFSKAKDKLNWSPIKTLDSIIEEMVITDIDRIKLSL
jgi:GDPmannose 4,6-dehydratase